MAEAELPGRLPAAPAGEPALSACDPVAGVRLADGRHLFVRGVPATLPAGASIRYVQGAEGGRGVVSISPALLVWCDPAVPCARFVALEQPPEAAAPLSAAPPLDLLLAEEGAPDAATLAAMLALARDEIGRLDDVGSYRPPRRSRQPDA